tara:strand:+ start:1644 stop:1787 length:144 start_codon:yes stop_codon:yes gene_type:complete
MFAECEQCGEWDCRDENLKTMSNPGGTLRVERSGRMGVVAYKSTSMK